MDIIEWPRVIREAMVQVMNGDDDLTLSWNEAKVRGMAFGKRPDDG